MTTAFMFDDVNVALIPSNAAVVAYYVDGRYANGTAISAHCPHALRVSIAVSASHDAEVLDVEPGDATVYQAAAWVRRQIARGVHLPVVYCSASTINTLESVMAANGLHRGTHYRIWSAHYTGRAHICGHGCGYPLADWTQYTDTALGHSLDESELPGLPSFSGAQVNTPASETFPYKEGMKDPNPTGGPIWTIQRGLNKWRTEIKLNPILATDGDFGPKTKAAVILAQQYWGQRGVEAGTVNQNIWAHLLVNPPAAPATTFGAPVGLKVNAAGYTSLKLSWSAPVGSEPVGPVEYWVYVYETATSPSIHNLVASYPRHETADSNVLVGGLKQNTHYTVHVVASGPGGSHIRPNTYASVVTKTSHK